MKFPIPHKHRFNSKSNNLIQYKDENITNLKLRLIFKLNDFSAGPFLNLSCSCLK